MSEIKTAELLAKLFKDNVPPEAKESVEKFIQYIDSLSNQQFLHYFNAITEPLKIDLSNLTPQELLDYGHDLAALWDSANVAAVAEKERILEIIRNILVVYLNVIIESAIGRLA